VIVWDVKRFGVSHAVLLLDHVLLICQFGIWCGFRCGCAAGMGKVTDGGLLALAGAGVGPGLEHLEFRSEAPDFQFNLWCFSVVVVTSYPPCSVLIVLWIFWVCLLVSNWVGCYQRALFPTGVVFLLSGRVCVDSEAC